MSNPHEDDFCVVCGREVRIGIGMHPVASIENGCVCEECVGSKESNSP